MSQTSDGWNGHWASATDHDYWLKPAEDVINLLPTLRQNRVTDVLDLGCGLGRHALGLAEAGFTVTAVDSSAAALKYLRVSAKERKLRITVRQGSYLDELFGGDCFDFVLAYNVIYHGGRAQFQRAVNLVASYLRSGGFFFLTCPTRKDGKYGRGPQVAAHTYRPDNSIHPGDVHYFADRADLEDLLAPFTVLNWDTDEHHWQNEGVLEFSSYWTVLAQKGQ